jgi:hypothetical protein
MKLDGDIICWWSGGITSAIACKLAIELYGLDSCRIVMIDTFNEHNDTYRFLADCEGWYGKKIERITALGENQSIKDVWYKFNSLNVAHGAICSSELKRDLRKRFEKENKYAHQVFGYDINETKRAKSMTLNYPNAKPIYPLLLHGYSKEMCIEIVESEGIEIPDSYKMGYHNNNCLGKEFGCTQGGIGYWQKIGRENPEAFRRRAKIEHELTDRAGKPVTMCRDQGKTAKESGNFQVFLIKHPDYPSLKCLADMEGREPKPLFECNGFGCAVNDLEEPNATEGEINRQTELEL